MCGRHIYTVYFQIVFLHKCIFFKEYRNYCRRHFSLIDILLLSGYKCTAVTMCEIIINITALTLLRQQERHVEPTCP